MFLVNQVGAYHNNFSGRSVDLTAVPFCLYRFFKKWLQARRARKPPIAFLSFFLALPLPTDKMKVLHNISNSKDSLSAHFLKDLRQFQLFMKDVIVAKKSVKTEEPVTGEGRVTFIQSNVVLLKSKPMQKRI